MRRIATALALLTAVFTACAAPARAANRAFVFESDFSTGSLSTVDLTPRTKHCDVASPNSDARLRFYNGKLYVVNRFGADNIQVIDPATNNTTLQFSVGAGANPYDIAFASASKAYVTRYESSDLWIVDPRNGAHTGTIALAAYADADGIPEMDHMITVGPLLFVSLQRVDRAHGFVATDTSLIVVIDTRTDTIVDCDPNTPGVQAIRLQLANPVTTFGFDAATSRLLIGCVGRYGVLDGGLEWIDPVGLKSAGVAMGESALKGDVTALSVAPGSLGTAHTFVIVSDASFNTLLLKVAPASGALLDTLYAPGGFSIADAAENDRGELYVCDNGFTAPGVRVFSAASGELLTSPLLCTLPPVAVTFDAATGSVGSVDPQAPRFALSLPAPCPARTQAAFTLTLPQAGEGRLEAFDAGGRRVRTLLEGALPAGANTAVWDLRDASGRAVAPGIYLVRAVVAGGTATRRVIVTR